jgi:hypothetical protein
VKLSARHLAAFGAGALALANVGRIPLGALGGRTSPFVVADIATLLVWIAIATALLTRRVKATLDDISLPAVAFIAVATVSTVLSIGRYNMGFGEAFGTVAFLVRWVFYFGWYLFVVWCLAPGETRLAWRYVETAILIFCAFGIFQSAFLPGFAQMVPGGAETRAWDQQGHRLVSTMLDPNLAGLLIVIVLLVRLARVAEGIREHRDWVVLLVLGAALLLTISRSSALALLVGLLSIVAMRGIRSRFSYVVVVGLVLMAPVLFLMRSYLESLNKLRIDTSAMERFIPWARGAALFMEHPVLGVGFNATAQAQHAHGWVLLGNSGVSMDGGLLFIAVMTGTAGLLTYCWMLWRVRGVARFVYNNPARSAADRALGVGTVAATAAAVVHSLFGNSLLLSFVMQALWVLWATLAHTAFQRRVVTPTGEDAMVAPGGLTP